MAFGDRIRGLFDNLAAGDWYLGKNVGLQPGQANEILAKGGPAATTLAFLLRSKGTPEAEIAAATQPIVIQAPAQKKQDLTPLYIGLGVLAVILVMKK